MTGMPMEISTSCREAGTPPSLAKQYRLVAERIYFLSCLLMLWNLGCLVLPAASMSVLSTIFQYTTWIVYSFLYCMPLYLLLLLAGTLLGLRATRGEKVKSYPIRTTIFCLLALVLLFATQTLIYADAWIYAIFEFHINGFVLNLLMTPGGLSSMDMSQQSTWGFALRLTILFAAQLAIVFVAFRVRWIARCQQRVFGNVKRRVVFISGLLFFLLAQIAGYGLARATWYKPVLNVADAVPFYLPISFNHIVRSMGWNVAQDDLAVTDDETATLHCPKQPMAFGPNPHRYNVVVLMCETLRADMLTPRIMPETSAFAQRSITFRNHYSSGNSTREGVFGAMTGLHGTYWRNMLRDGQGSSIVNFLRNNGYEMELFTSQSFSYPEFDRTVFATVSPEHMHVRSDGPPSWERDRQNVTDILRWLGSRDRNVPFMTFMFFESSHARYAFPPESVIESDFCESVNYASDLIDPNPKQIRQVFNRYINSVHHLDSQLGRVVKCLEETGQLDNTIVIITGDHGDSFYEKGRWGHGGHSFLEEEIHVPLVMHIPGVPPQEITELTSHVDIFPTALAAMGLKNPPADYSLGRNALQPAPSDAFVVCSGWDTLALITETSKFVLPYRGFRLPQAYTRDDQPQDEQQARRALQSQLVGLMKQMRQFLK